MINKIGPSLPPSLLSVQKNQSAGNALDEAIAALGNLAPQDTVTLSDEAQKALALKPIEKLQLENGAAPTRLADVVYVRSLPETP